jgi:hypothetical protein
MEVGLGVGDLQALTEKAFVAAAQNALAEEGAPQPDNAARIALRTGLYRHTVNNLLSMAGSQGVRTKPFQNFSVRVMRGWRSLPDYCEASGSPLILPVRGEPPSFHSLTKATIGEDLPPSLILQDLQRVGAVKAVAKGHVQLIRNIYGNGSWDVAQIAEMGEELRDHVRALVQLLQQRDPPPLRRFIVHPGLHGESAAILEREISRGANVLFNVHQRAIEQVSESTKNTPGQKHRLTASVVIMREPVPQEIQVKKRSRDARSPAKPGSPRVRKLKKPR